MQLVVALVLVPSVMLTLGAVLAAEFTGAGAGLRVLTTGCRYRNHADSSSSASGTT